MNQCITPGGNRVAETKEDPARKIATIASGITLSQKAPGGTSTSYPVHAPMNDLSPEQLEVLLRRAFFMARAAFDEAESTYAHYDVEDTDGDADTCTWAQIRQPKPMHLSVIVHTIDDTCTCSIFRTAVLPLRARLLESGLTVMELQARRQWPTCKHPIITAFLQAMEPGKFAACLTRKQKERGH